MYSEIQHRKIAFIGTGNMAEAIIKGLLRVNVAPENIIASAPREVRRRELSERYGIVVEADNGAAAAAGDVVVFAVKPQILPKVAQEIAKSVREDTLLVSIAAGITIAQIESYMGGTRSICRCMPNLPALVGAGATAVVKGVHASDNDIQLVEQLFKAVGTVAKVEESLMDAVTGLSGSGPAYIFLMIEALADAGVKVGLPRYQAQALAAQTVMGSAKLLIDTDGHPGMLKDRVTSPGGTAIAGLHTLEEGGLRPTLINAVIAATERSRQLGEK